MAQVSFYILQTQQRQADFACRVCRKVATVEHIPLLVLFDHATALHAFDNALWQFDASSFVPHDVDDTLSPICLSQHIPNTFKGICLNLSAQQLDPLRFERVLEIIENNEDAKTIGRQKFKHYREHGAQPTIFNI